MKKRTKVLIFTIILSLLLSNSVFASDDVDYFELNNELQDNNSSLAILDLNVQNMKIDVYKAELNSISMQSRLNFFSDIGFPVSTITKSNMMYVRDIVPVQVNYGLGVLTSNRELTEATLKVAVRQLSTGLISSSKSYDLALEKYEFYQMDYDNYQLQYSLGQVSYTDLLKAEVKMLEGKTTFDKALRTLEDSYLSLNSLVGYDLDYRYDVALEEQFEIELKEPAYYLNYALSNRFELIDIQDQIDVQVMIADFYDYGDFLAYYSNYKAMKDAEIEKTKLELGLELKKLEITEEIYSSLSDINILKQQIKQLENTLEIQENDYNKLLAQVAQGYITSSTIKELEFAIKEIKNNLDVMIYSYNTKHYELHNATFFGPAYGGGI